MKRLIHIFILLAISSIAIAQKLSVERFEATNDLTARDSRYVREDLNGNPCALIKVQVALTGVEFEGNKIGDVQYKTSEYWVYLPAGDKRLKIKHSNFLPLTVQFADYGIERLVSKMTYVLVLNAASTTSATQTLTVKYSPSNATLLIDGKLIKGNKGIATLDLPVGSHSYNAVLDGYVEQMGAITLSATSPGKLVIELDKESSVASNSVKPTISSKKQEKISQKNDENKSDSLEELEDFISAQKKLAKERLRRVEFELGMNTDDYVSYKVLLYNGNVVKDAVLYITSSEITYLSDTDLKTVLSFKQRQDVENWAFVEGTKEYIADDGERFHITVEKKQNYQLKVTIRKGSKTTMKFILLSVRFYRPGNTPKFGLG